MKHVLKTFLPKPLMFVDDINLPYITRQESWVQFYRVKEGDKMLILRRAETGEMGWDNIWATQMNRKVGGIFEVAEINKYYGIYMADYQFPYFVLQKIN